MSIFVFTQDVSHTIDSYSIRNEDCRRLGGLSNHNTFSTSAAIRAKGEKNLGSYQFIVDLSTSGVFLFRFFFGIFCLVAGSPGLSSIFYLFQITVRVLPHLLFPGSCP